MRWEVDGFLHWLELDSQANAVTTRRSDAGARKEAGKIDHVDPIVKVLHVGLQAHEEVFSLHQFGAYRSSQRKGRPYPAALKVHTIDNLLPELLDGILYGAIELSGQAAPIASSERHPGARHFWARARRRPRRMDRDPGPAPGLCRGARCAGLTARNELHFPRIAAEHFSKNQ